jgi:NADH:ubiquinone oxidoreductase subunit F (NADH-binding)
MTARLHAVETGEFADGALLGDPVHYFGSAGAAVSELLPHSLATHRRCFGPRRLYTVTSATALLEQLSEPPLTGRGGAHFPTAAKWRAARSGSAPHAVVANGAEGEPLSRKDRALLELRPHLVLDGLACAVEAVGAAEAVVWMHDSNHAARVSLSRALAERESHEDDPPIRIEVGPDSYLSGESSAVANAVTGAGVVPTYQRRSGRSRSVLVHNVETLARVGLVAHGLPGTETVLVSVAVATGVVVIELGPTDTIGDAVSAVAGEARTHAVLVGGYGGSWVPWFRASDLLLDEPSLRSCGLSLGAGIVHPLTADRCGLQRAAEIAAYLAGQSARQCGPCAFGLPAIADSLAALAEVGGRGRRARRMVADIHELIDTVDGRGACHHPDGAVRMVASAMRTFHPDVQAHLQGGCRHSSYRGRRNA